MHRIFRLLVLATFAAYIGARLTRRTGAPAHTEGTLPMGAMPTTEDGPEVAGISGVDPEEWMGFGEGIDPEMVRNAHAQPALLRDP